MRKCDKSKTFHKSLFTDIINCNLPCKFYAKTSMNLRTIIIDTKTFYEIFELFLKVFRSVKQSKQHPLKTGGKTCDENNGDEILRRCWRLCKYLAGEAENRKIYSGVSTWWIIIATFNVGPSKWKVLHHRLPSIFRAQNKILIQLLISKWRVETTSAMANIKIIKTELLIGVDKVSSDADSHKGDVTCLVVHNDLLYSAGRDGKIKVRYVQEVINSAI